MADQIVNSNSIGVRKSNCKLSLVPYWFLCVLRVLLTVLPQTGYIHPDEYFQYIEVVNGDMFGVESTRSWEFNTTFPIRSVALPYAVVGVPLLLLKIIAPFFVLWFGLKIVTPYTLLVVPRLVCCLLSFITDYSLYRICCIYGQNYRIRLLTLASSYVLLIYGTRTFSNSIEMVLTSLLIYVVSECMAHSDKVIHENEYLRECYDSADTMKEKVRFLRCRGALPSHSFSRCWTIATVSALGVFNRPTFLAFAFPPIFFWLQRGMGTRFIGLSDFHLRILLLITSALPTVLILILIDSFYYGYITWSEIVQWKISLDANFVVTPYNFFKYNINPINLVEHGLHPRLTHILVNVPLLYNILGLAGCGAIISILHRVVQRRWSELPRVQSIIGLMITSFVIPLALLSVFPHQEPRFIIPITLPLVFLNSQRIRNQNEVRNVCQKETDDGTTVFLRLDMEMNVKDALLMLWYTVNILLVLFFGFIHQAGIYPLMNHMSRELEDKPRLTHIHVITSHIYTLPKSLLHRKYGQFTYNKSGLRYQQAKDFFTYELGSSHNMDLATSVITQVLRSCETKWREKRLKYKLYFVLPSSLAQEFRNSAMNSNFSHEMDRVFYPHVSTEALPALYGDILKPCHQKTLVATGEDVVYGTSCQMDHILNTFTLDLPLRYFSNILHQFGLSLFTVTKR